MNVRIDKFLWAVRLFKTRADSASACGAGRVWLNGALVKSSRAVSVGDVIAIRRGAVTLSFRVLTLVSNRQPAKNVPIYIEDITPQEERDKLNVPRETIFIHRDRGTGRPTKKERRDMESLIDDIGYLSDDEFDGED